MEGKRRVSVLVPYKTKDGFVFVLLQKREKNHVRGGGMYGFIGGGIQGSETPEEALIRESEEEIGFVPKDFFLFKKYDLSGTKHFSSAELYLFILPAGDDFEKHIEIKSEGESYRWFSKENYLRNTEFIAGSLFILDELYNKLPQMDHKSSKIG